MPNYTFRNKQTGEEYIETMKIAELDQYLADHPEVEQVPVLVHVGDPWTQKKVPSGFRDVLGKIKRANRGSTVNPGNLTSI